MAETSRFKSKMPWRPLPNIIHAVCVRHFDGNGPDDLNLQLGDQVYITEVTGKENQWCRGWLLALPPITNGLSIDPNQSLQPRAYAGIFPRRCVHVREVLSDSDKLRARAYAQDSALRGHSRGNSLPTNGALSPTSNVNGISGSLKSPISPTRFEASQAPLVPRDVEPRRANTVREPAPLPALRIGMASKSEHEPLVDDITTSIRDWHSAKLHNLALKKDYKTLEELSTLVDRLADARRQLAHNLLTEKELVRLREQVIWDLVRGNKIVGSEVVVRDATQKGRTLTAQDNLPDLLQLQSVMSLRDKPVPVPAKETHLSHLLMDVKAVPQSLDDPALLLMYLCSVTSAGQTKAVSEAFAVELAIEESSGRVEVADHVAKTLFAELNNVDIGGGDQSDNRLYLICKLIRDEPMHRVGRKGAPNASSRPSEADDGNQEERGRTRRSLMGRVSRRNSESGDRPRTSSSMRSALRGSSQSRKEQKKAAAEGAPNVTELDPTRRTRRVAGWTAVSVSSFMREQASERVKVSFWKPTMPHDQVVDPIPGKDGWEDILKLLVRTRSTGFTRAEIGTLTLDLTAFASDQLDTLIREKPTLLRDVHQTPAVSLNSSSKLPRSDIYLTLRAPHLPARAMAFHPKQGNVNINTDLDLLNLQITLEVRRNDGKRIEDAIHPTANRRPHTAFRSPAIERSDAWNQTIKLSVSSRDVPNAHIIMSIADSSHYPFALAWLPLWDRTKGFPPDGQQNLALWDYCEYTANTHDGKGAYQSLPVRAEDMPDLNGPLMGTISVETHLSSTSATQNADVLLLSSLRHMEAEDLAPLLDRFQAIPDEEIAKFFGPILVSLDHVIEQYSSSPDARIPPAEMHNNRECSRRAVKAFAHAARLIKDRRYPHVEPLLNDYLIRRAPSIDARLTILRTLRALLANPFDARGGRELRNSLKVTDVLLKLALYRQSAAEDHEEDPAGMVRREASELFEDLTILLSNNNHLALATQVIIVQNLHLWLPATLPMCSEADVVRFASAAAYACVNNKASLWPHRLTMIYNIFKVPKFQSPSLRAAIVDKTELWLEPIWPETEEVDEIGIASIRLCCTILKDQQPYMTHQQSQRYVRQLFNAYYVIKQGTEMSNKKQPRRSRKELSTLFPTTYPFTKVTTSTSQVPLEVLLEITAVLGTFFQPGSAVTSVDLGASTNGNSNDTINLLGEADLAKALYVVRSVQQSGAFPESWLSLAVSFSRVQVSILDFLLDNMRLSLPSASDDPDGEAVLDFDGALWQHWFDALFALVTGELVGMENHSEQKRRAVWNVGGDIREVAAGLLQKAWDALGWENDEESESMFQIAKVGGYQVQFTSTLIPAVVQLGLSLHSGLRAVAIEVLRSMIIGEWELSNDLEVIKSVFTDTLDVAFRDSKFEPSQAKVLLDSLLDRVAYMEDTGAESLHAAVVEVLSEVRALLDMLSDVHNAGQDLPASQLEQRVRLLEHLKETNNEDSYLRHIHDVAESQVGNRNYSSAATAMQLHLAILKQNSSPETDVQLAKPYPDLQLPSQTIYQRRMMLYAAMVKYYRLGCCWSKVLDTLEEQRLELVTAYDSANLATVLRDQADTYQKLSSGKGLLMPRFFKVNFNNNGFPNSVKGRSFIFEAAPDDDTRGFARRLKHWYPMATVVHSGVTSSTAATDAPKIHVISVNVNRDHFDPINLRVGVSPFYRLFHLSSNPITFSNSTRQQKPGLSVSEQTVAKTVYTTDEPFPNLLGRAEIIKEEALILTAIQAAIDRTHRKTMDIAEVLMNTPRDESVENDRLAQIIRASVDPSYIDSVAAYHELLLSDSSAFPSPRSSRHTSRATSALTSREGTRPNSDHGGGPKSSGARSTTPLDNAPPIPPSDAEAATERRATLVRVLTTALRDHAQTIEQALAAAFSKRPAARSRLRDDLEATFEPELFGIYPDGRWRENSPAWRDTTLGHPASSSSNGAAAAAAAASRGQQGQQQQQEGVMSGLGFSTFGGLGALGLEPLADTAVPGANTNGVVQQQHTTSGIPSSTQSTAAAAAAAALRESGTSGGAASNGPKSAALGMGYASAVESETETEGGGGRQSRSRRAGSRLRKRLSSLSRRGESRQQQQQQQEGR